MQISKNMDDCVSGDGVYLVLAVDSIRRLETEFARQVERLIRVASRFRRKETCLVVSITVCIFFLREKNLPIVVVVVAVVVRRRYRMRCSLVFFFFCLFSISSNARQEEKKKKNWRQQTKWIRASLA